MSRNQTNCWWKQFRDISDLEVRVTRSIIITESKTTEKNSELKISKSRLKTHLVSRDLTGRIVYCWHNCGLCGTCTGLKQSSPEKKTPISRLYGLKKSAFHPDRNIRVEALSDRKTGKQTGLEKKRRLGLWKERTEKDGQKEECLLEINSRNLLKSFPYFYPKHSHIWQPARFFYIIPHKTRGFWSFSDNSFKKGFWRTHLWRVSVGTWESSEKMRLSSRKVGCSRCFSDLFCETCLYAKVK